MHAKQPRFRDSGWEYPHILLIFLAHTPHLHLTNACRRRINHTSLDLLHLLLILRLFLPILRLKIVLDIILMLFPFFLAVHSEHWEVDHGNQNDLALNIEEGFSSRTDFVLFEGLLF
jgi:hypothetical protein